MITGKIDVSCRFFQETSLLLPVNTYDYLQLYMRLKISLRMVWFRSIYSEPRREKKVLGVSDQVRHKPGCNAIEDG